MAFENPIPAWHIENGPADRAVMRVRPAPGGHCEIEWRGDYETDQPEEMQVRAAQVFERGFTGLRACLGDGKPAQ